jgi:N4-(beta-N-acetylglucosaminyl)-L-asparaginase
MSTSRREFLIRASAIGAGAMAAGGLSEEARAAMIPPAGSGPVVIASGNGLASVAKAVEMITRGADALDAVIAGVNLVEDDPNDHTVGYGGLPNEDGVVELDAAVMHGPTGRAGAVASLQKIRNPSKVARVVMDRSDHVLLVGEGALRFAKAHGFKEEELLTDAAREIWLKWKETMSTQDDRLPPHDQQTSEGEIGGLVHPGTVGDDLPFHRSTGTIHCSGIDLKGNISCVTTTSGLAFKIPGRVGDSPILGAGLWVDDAVGAAGSTGRGEANLYNLSSFFIVEEMRRGRSPRDAGLEALRRVKANTVEKRLLDARGNPNFQLIFYAVNKKGEYAGVSMYAREGQEPERFAVCTEKGPELIACEPLFGEAPAE